jgi:hypothetical protein
MRTSLLAAAAAAATVILAAVPAEAQRAPAAAVAPTPFQVTPYMGTMLGTRLADGPLGTSLSTAPAAIYGAQLGVELAPSLAVVGNFGYSTSTLRAGAPLLGGVNFGSTRAMFYDATLQLEIPRPLASGLVFTPLLAAGAGGLHMEAESRGLSASATSPVWVLAAGADLTVGRGMGIRFMARDHVGKLDFREAIGFDVNDSPLHHVALTVGLRLSF